jgi:hypothetical protein
MIGLNRRKILHLGLIGAALPLALRSAPNFVTSALAADPTIDLNRFAEAKTLTGVNLKLPSGLLKTGKSTVIWTDTLVLAGSYETDGGSLLIVARRIEAGADTVLSTKGADALVSLQGRANDGGRPGDPGSPGANGANGKSGGDIVLILEELAGSLSFDARGGNGANGQSGGNGAVGSAGGQGPQCTNGARGGTGGSAGPGGKGGDGGDGGLVWVQYGSSVDVSKIKSAFSAGTPGRAGQNGVPGGGGPGGPGGPAFAPLPERGCGPPGHGFVC